MTDTPLTVLKIGGAICREAGLLRSALDAAARLARRVPLLVLPGGGVFADQVRVAHRMHGLSDETAHWMAILAMDQVACLIADQLEGARLVRQRAEILPAHAAGTIPVLAPHGWMRSADALPRSWDVTSDSIAAYIARELDAGELILLKPVEGRLEALVDPAFASVRPAGLRVRAATPATLEAPAPR